MEKHHGDTVWEAMGQLSLGWDDLEERHEALKISGEILSSRVGEVETKLNTLNKSVRNLGTSYRKTVEALKTKHKESGVTDLSFDNVSNNDSGARIDAIEIALKSLQSTVTEVKTLSDNVEGLAYSTAIDERLYKTLEDRITMLEARTIRDRARVHPGIDAEIRLE